MNELKKTMIIGLILIILLIIVLNTIHPKQKKKQQGLLYSVQVVKSKKDAFIPLQARQVQV